MTATTQQGKINPDLSTYAGFIFLVVGITICLCQAGLLRLFCSTLEKDTVLFPQSAFSIVRKHYSRNRREQTKRVRLHFNPRVNGNSAISYSFEKYDPDVTTNGCEELSW
ncbi:hypothetical protein DVG40_24245 [Salmonella enterica subsp. enterica serovar Inganda]|nr:hypothetical protein [Salmonella enterica subsp. enterica serovar Inganda]